jgi:hypothetical protein
MKPLSGTSPSMPAPALQDQPTRLRKLTPDAVLDIWSRREPQTVYMERYSVSRKPIQDIQQGKTWRWVTADAPTPAKRLPSGPRKRVDGAA